MKRSNRIMLSAALPLLAVGVLIFVRTHGSSNEMQLGAGSKVVFVKRGGDLQAAIKAARFGDTIVLEAGASYMGPIVLSNKGPGTGGDADFITIRTSDLAGIAREGERIQPEQHAARMPKILSPNNQAAVSTLAQAHHYKFIGIEFAPAANAAYVFNLIDLGASDYNSYSQFPHHLVFDRCYVHSTGLNRARRGFALNSGETSVTNSYVSGFAGEGDETQAIAGWNGPGPFHIVNNFLQAGAEVIMFGGADPSIRGLVPSDIEIRKNHLHKPAAWKGRATIKGTFELKNARRVTVDGNVLESEILTTAFVLTTRNQNGGAPWSTIEDVTISNNIVRHASTGFNILGSDSEHPSQMASRIRISNNLLIDLVPDDPNNSAYFIQVNGVDSLTVEHNTVQQKGNIITGYGTLTRNFVFRNNVVQHNRYGVVCLNEGEPCRENYFCRCFPGAVFKGNVMADNLGVRGQEAIDYKYPPGNWFAVSYDRLGFVDYARGNWRLNNDSRFRRRGTDNKDPGIDVDALLNSGVTYTLARL